jgi:hypothetical protein
MKPPKYTVFRHGNNCPADNNIRSGDLSGAVRPALVADALSFSAGRLAGGAEVYLPLLLDIVSVRLLLHVTLNALGIVIKMLGQALAGHRRAVVAEVELVPGWGR